MHTCHMHMSMHMCMHMHIVYRQVQAARHTRHRHHARWFEAVHPPRAAIALSWLLREAARGLFAAPSCSLRGSMLDATCYMHMHMHRVHAHVHVNMCMGVSRCLCQRRELLRC